MYDALVIGAGLSGSICAQHLQEAGLQVLVLDKSRGVGGRMAARRADTAAGPIVLDHGAQYITAKGDRFSRFVNGQVALGVMAEWGANLHAIEAGELRAGDLDDRQTRYCCPAGMTAVAKHLRQGLTIKCGSRVVAIEPEANGWKVETDGGEQFEAKGLVMALPAPQILELLVGWLPQNAPLYGPLQSAAYLACIAVMAGYEGDRTPPVWQGVKWLDDDRVVWTALDSSKRPEANAPAIVVHSTPEFAADHLDDSPAELQEAGKVLLQRVGSRLGGWLAKPEWMQVHRWRYSLPIEPVGLMSLGMQVPVEKSESGPNSARSWPLVCAGDWCAGPKVEGAFMSGLDAGERLLSMLSQ